MDRPQHRRLVVDDEHGRRATAGRDTAATIHTQPAGAWTGGRTVGTERWPHGRAARWPPAPIMAATTVAADDRYGSPAAVETRPCPRRGRAASAEAAPVDAGRPGAPGVMVARRRRARRDVLRDRPASAPSLVDPVPRVMAAAEWTALARGLQQRLRALDVFVADVHAPQRIIAEGVGAGACWAARSTTSRARRATAATTALDRASPASTWCAAADGELAVLEGQNLRTPSGWPTPLAAREAVAARRAAGRPADAAPRGLDGRSPCSGAALRAATPPAVPDAPTLRHIVAAHRRRETARLGARVAGPGARRPSSCSKPGDLCPRGDRLLLRPAMRRST